MAVDPCHVEVLNNRGNALAAIGRHEEALASLPAAPSTSIRITSTRNGTWHCCKLRLGDYAGGWPQYEWRWQREENAKHRHAFAQPLWLGDAPVAGKTILLHHEQGFGDTIQMARYAPLLVRQGARVILGVQPPLKTLFANIGEGIEAIGSGEPIPSFDLHCPLHEPAAGVPHRARARSPRTFLISRRRPNGSRNGQRACRSGQGLRVGLVWSGNATHRDDHNRSIALARLAPLFDVPGVQFVSLQKDLREADAQVLAAEPRIADIGRDFGDFCDTAAAVAAMDLVISVDTSVAHLAGALGKPVWVLLPLCPDWRWLTDREDSPWYPTARLFRQPRVGDWDSVIGRGRPGAGEARPSGACLVRR